MLHVHADIHIHNIDTYCMSCYLHHMLNSCRAFDVMSCAVCMVAACVVVGIADVEPACILPQHYWVTVIAWLSEHVTDKPIAKLLH